MWKSRFADVPRLRQPPCSLNAASSCEAVSRDEKWREPLVGIIMGSTSDWETMRHAAETLDALGVAHETQGRLGAPHAASGSTTMRTRRKERGLKVIIAGAGGAAHLPGMAASMTALPVLGVPVESQALKGMDSLLSIVQMPAGVPVGTLAIGKAGRDQRRRCSPPRSSRPATRRSPRGSTRWREQQTESVAETPE